MITAIRRAVFVETAAFAALAIAHDQNSRRANDLFQELAGNRVRLITSNLIVAESYSLILARAGREPAIRTLRSIDRRAEDVIRVTAEDEHRARAILQQYQDKSFGLVDAISFAVMERLGITEAFAFDRHFAQFGFRLIGDR